MKKFFKESEKEELCGREEVRQMMGHTLRHGGLVRDILEGGEGREKGKKAQIRIFRPNNWGYGM